MSAMKPHKGAVPDGWERVPGLTGWIRPKAQEAKGEDMGKLADVFAGIETIKGKDGIDGKDGRDGVDGKDGRDGVDGKDGRDGVDGKDGRDGVKGIDGKDGKPGKNGKDGKDGKDGADGVGISEVKGYGSDVIFKLSDGKENRIKIPLSSGGTPFGGNMSGGGAGGGVQSVVAGTNVTVDNTDPANPIVSATGGSGGHIIQDEGVSLTQRTHLNFVGTGVTVTDGGAGSDDTIVTITAGGGTSDHESLTGLQGGTTGQHVHLTNAEYNNLNSPIGGSYAVTGDYTFDSATQKNKVGIWADAKHFTVTFPSTPSDFDRYMIGSFSTPPASFTITGNKYVYKGTNIVMAANGSSTFNIANGWEGVLLEFVYFAQFDSWMLFEQDYLGWMQGQIAWGKVDKTGATTDYTFVANIGAAALYHNHQAGIERDEITNLFPTITTNAATSRTTGYTLEQWRQYKIVTRATVDFTTCGAANNTAGTYFTCTLTTVTLGAGDEVTEATIAVAAGSAWMFDEADMDSMTLHTISAATELTFIPNEPNYVCADRDTNTWVVLNSVTTPAAFDYVRYVPYFVANARTGSTSFHNQPIVLQAHGEIESIHQAKFECGRYDIATGALRSISCADTTLALGLGGGNVFAAYYKYTLPAVSTATRQFNCLWLGGSNWSYTSNTSPVLVNTSYNTSGAMTALTAGYFACLYMWRGVEEEDHIYTYYSQEQFATLELAKASSMPSSVPPLAEGHGVFVGRIVFQQGQTTTFLGQSAFDTVFAAATSITIHNDLSGLNLGDYLHLSAAQKTALTTGVSADAQHTHGRTTETIRNETGVAIAAMKAVYVTGFNNVPLVDLADNTNNLKHHPIGVTTAAINHQADGTVVTGGLLTGVNTNGFTAVGSKLYLGTAGTLTETMPTSGEIIFMGEVMVKSATVGQILLYHDRGVDYIAAASAQNVHIRMGDSAAATKVVFEDYADVEVASIDSDGNAIFTGVTVGGVSVGAKLHDRLHTVTSTSDHTFPGGTQYLRSDGTWQTLAGGGDMLGSNNLSDVANAATARNNILPTRTGNALKVLRVTSDETGYELATASSSADYTAFAYEGGFN